MSHYKSNLRDIQFNLFEVLRRQDLLGQPPYDELDEETVRGILGELERLATGPLAESFADADRNPPVFDPATHSVRIPESLRKSYRAFMDAEWYRLSLPAELGGTGAPRSLNWAMAELILGSNPAVWMYASGHTMARVLWDLGTRRAEAVRRAGHRARVGRHHGADRARRRLRRRRGPDPGDRAAGRDLAHRGGQALHHQRRARPGGQHLPPRAGPAGGPRPGHQGPVHVPRAQVPGRRGRDARRAERRRHHQRRAQDGPEGLDHLRGHLRRRTARGRHPGRRRARRHQADVHGHRGRPDDGRHQGHRHLVHRLPERAGLRQEPGPGRGPHPDDGQDRAAGDDHPPPRRAPDADAAEGVRRGHAGAGAVHGLDPGRHPARRGAGADRRGPPRA